MMKQTYIYIKILKCRTIIIEINLSETILMIKNKIKNIEGFEPSQQRLFFKGIELKNNEFTLEDYNIIDKSILCLVLRLIEI